MKKLKSSPLILDTILGQRSKLTLLRCLYQNLPGMSGRELARRTGLSHQTVLQSLEDLSDSGVVLKERIPPAYRFTLNLQHWVIADILKGVFEKEQGWVSSLINEIATQLPKSVHSIVLYGSLARGELSLESDVDLLVLIEDLQKKEEVEEYLSMKSLALLPIYKHKISTIVYEIAYFKKQYKEGNHFIREVVNTGRVLWGKLLTEILFSDVTKTHSTTLRR